MVFDFRFCHGGSADRTPVHGLQSLVDIALVKHPSKDLDLLGLEVLVHGAVGMLPVTHHAQALEAGHLALNIGLGELLAGGTELGDRHGLVIELALLDDGGLDGQTMVVPAGDIGGVVT